MFASLVFLVYQALIPPTFPRLSIKSACPAPRTACSPAPARRVKKRSRGGRWGKRVNRGRSLKMAASLSSTRLAAALAPAPPSAKSPHSKATAAVGPPDGSRSHCSRDFNPPPPKKVRVEERSVKPKKLYREGAGVGGSGREKLQQPAKSCGGGCSWNVSPMKSCGGAGGGSGTTTTSNSSAPPAPATSQSSTNAHKLFKQSDFFLHKAPSSKPKKPSKDKLREKDKSKGGDEEREEKRKHKLFPPAVHVNHGGDIISSSRFSNSSVLKRENGEVTSSLPKGRPPSQCIIIVPLNSC